MIIQTGMRTDIPAFYSRWFANRIKEGYVMVRNPYNPQSVTRYSLSPDVVDIIGFCSKNPSPMFEYMPLLKSYGQYWFVTITPYGKDTEPNVPPKEKVIEDFKKLSRMVGVNSVGWRYDPIFINEVYTLERHLNDFEQMAHSLTGYTETCVISFIDLYSKVKRNFPEAKEVTAFERITLGRELVKIAAKYGMTVKACAEGNDLEPYGVDCDGCMTAQTYEKALGERLNVPKKQTARKACACFLTNDIGAYDTCGHLCRYCYANVNAQSVRRNMERHNPDSPFLIGELMPDDVVHNALQESYIDCQLHF